MTTLPTNPVGTILAPGPAEPALQEFNLLAVLALLPEEHRPSALLPSGEGDQVLCLLQVANLLTTHSKLNLERIALTGGPLSDSWLARFMGLRDDLPRQSTPRRALQGALMSAVRAAPGILEANERDRQDRETRVNFRERSLQAIRAAGFWDRDTTLGNYWFRVLLPWLISATEADLSFKVSREYKFSGDLLTAHHAHLFQTPYSLDRQAPQVAVYMPPEDRIRGLTVGEFRRLIKMGVLSAQVAPDGCATRITPNPVFIQTLREHNLLPSVPFTSQELHPSWEKE